VKWVSWIVGTFAFGATFFAIASLFCFGVAGYWKLYLVFDMSGVEFSYMVDDDDFSLSIPASAIRFGQRGDLLSPLVLGLEYEGFDIWAIRFPHWLTNLITWSLFFILWRKRRKHPEGHCRRCGYDLTGNESGCCPECNTIVAKQSEAAE